MKHLLFSFLMVPLAFSCTAQETEERAFEPPLMGWSSWNTFYANINEEIVKEQADAMVSKGLRARGYKYINIDDGFQWDRDADGRLQINPTRFPNGLKPVVDYIHGKGLKAGIYSDAGRSTCANFYGGETHESESGLFGHDDQDCEMFFNELEFDYIKVDFCGGTSWQNFEKLDLSAEKRYKEIAEAIKRTGRKVSYNVCRWAFPGTWVCDIAESWRVTEDINASWESVKGIIQQNLYLSAYCGNGHYNDMDMLEVGRGLTTVEDKTHFGMWCIMSSPLLIGCDLRNVSGTTLSLLSNKELIALNQDSLGLQAYVVNHDNGAYILVKDVETRNGLKRAVAMYNPTDEAKKMTLKFRDVELAGDVVIHDCLNRRDIDNPNHDSYTATVAAHGVRILTLTAEYRLLRTLYEAETAWLSSYQELENHQAAQTGMYEANNKCSGGMKAGWLGMRANNDLQWRNVYVDEAGEYNLVISFLSGENRYISVDVNDQYVDRRLCNSGGFDTVGTTQIRVNLKEGNNVVRLYNKSGWMPDIDCMRLNPMVPNAIDAVETNKTSTIVTDLNGRIIRMAEGTDLSKQLPAGIYVKGNHKFLIR